MKTFLRIKCMFEERRYLFFKGPPSKRIMLHEFHSFSYFKSSLAKLIYDITVGNSLSARKKIKLFVIYWCSRLSSQKCKIGKYAIFNRAWQITGILDFFQIFGENITFLKLKMSNVYSVWAFFCLRRKKNHDIVSVGLNLKDLKRLQSGGYCFS